MRRALAVALTACVATGCIRAIPTGPPITTGPVSVADRVEYWIAQDQALGVSTVEDALALEMRMRVDPGSGNSGPYAVVMAPILCEQYLLSGSAGWMCSAMLPPGVVDRVNAVGKHAITMSAFKDNEGSGSTPWVITTSGTPAKPPAPPVGSTFSVGCSGIPGEVPGETCKP